MRACLAWLLGLMVVVWAVTSGCRCPRETGSREYRPGQGWVPAR